MAVSIGLIGQTIEKAAPKYWAEDWDNVGLLVGDPSVPVERALLALDGTMEVLEEAREIKAQLIIAHHPILFQPLKNLRSDNLAARLPLALVKSDIAYYAAHTNLDQSRFSSSVQIAALLGLKKTELLTTTEPERQLKLVVFTPKPESERVRQALVKIGVGEGITAGAHRALYSESFFAAEGTGMFRPLEGAEPSLGEIGVLTRVEETRLETVIPERLAERAIKAIIGAHPYEEPAIDLIPLRSNVQPRGYGMLGYLEQAASLREVRERVYEGLLGILPESYGKRLQPGMPYTGDLQKPIRKIAIANGSGGSALGRAMAKGADLLITGDVDHHKALDALEAGIAVLDLGHFWSEVPMLATLAEYLQADKATAQVEFLISQKMSTVWQV